MPTAKPTAKPAPVPTVLPGADVDGALRGTGVITGKAANIHAQPSASSDVLGRVSRNDALSVLGQTQGKDGYTWYQVDAGGVIGYVRSNLMTVSAPILPIVKIEAVPQRQLSAAAAEIARQLSAASAEMGMPVRLLHIEKILTDEEWQQASGLPLKEQMAVLLAAIGHEDALQTLEISDATRALMASAAARIGSLPEQEQATFRETIARLFQEEEKMIDGATAKCFALEVLLELNGKTYVERYSFRYDADSAEWTLYQVDNREPAGESL